MFSYYIFYTVFRVYCYSVETYPNNSHANEGITNSDLHAALERSEWIKTLDHTCVSEAIQIIW